MITESHSPSPADSENLQSGNARNRRLPGMLFERRSATHRMLVRRALLQVRREKKTDRQTDADR